MEQFPATNPNPVLSVRLDGTVLYSNVAGDPLLHEWGISVGEKLPPHIENTVHRAISLKSPEKTEVKAGNRVYLVSFHLIPEEECVNIYGFDISEQKELEGKLRVLQNEVQNLRARLEEPEELQRAISRGDLDALVMPVSAEDLSVFILDSADSAFSTLVKTANEDMVIVDAEFKITYIGKKLINKTGYSQEEVIGRSWLDFIDESSKPVAKQGMEQILQGIDESYELKLLCKNSSPYWALIGSKPLFDNDGKFKGVLGMLTDITKRKRMEEALEESEKQYRMLFDKSMDGIILTDPRGVGLILSANPAACKMLGWTEEELILKGLDEIFDVKNPALSTLLDEHIPSGSAKSQINYRRKDGTILNGEVSNTFFIDRNGAPRAVSIIRDITERKRAEEALRESEEKYRLLIEHAPSAIYEIDLIGQRFISVNEGACKILGYTEAELMAMSPIDVLGEESRGVFLDREKKALSGEPPADYIEYNTKRKDGSDVWSMLHTKFRYNNGQLVEAFVIAHDITERKRMEEALEITLQRFYTILSNIQGAILLVSEEGYVEFANDTFCKWFNLSEKPADLVGITSSEMLRIIKEVYDDPDSAMALIKENVEHGKPVFGEEISLIDGRTVIRDFIPLSVGGKRSGRLWDHIDITGRKKAEEALQKSHAELEAALDSMTDAVFISDTLGNFIEFNDAFATFHKFKNKNECARTLAEYPEFLEVFLADEIPAPLDMWAVPRALRGEIVTDAEYTLRRKDTGETWVGSYNFAPIRDKDGEVVGSVVVARDITKRKQEEQKMLRYNKVLEGINQIFSNVVQAKTEEELANSCLSVALEVTGSQLGFVNLLGGDGLMHDIAISEMGWSQCLMYDKSGHRRTPGNFVIHGLYGSVINNEKGFFTNDPPSHPDSIGVPDGHPALKSFLGVPLVLDGKTMGIVGVANREGGYSSEQLEDLEAIAPAMMQALQRRKSEEALCEAYENLQAQSEELQVQNEELQAQSEELHEAYETLRESESRFRLVLDGSNDVIYRVNMQSNSYVYISPSVEALIGFTQDEAIAIDAETGLSMIHPDDLSMMWAAIEHLKETGKSNAEYRQRTKNGDYIWVSNRMSLTKDSAGQPLYRSGNIHDITERKRMEETLRESREKIEVALANMSDAVFISDAQGNFVNYNDAFVTYHRFKDRADCSKNFSYCSTILDVRFTDTGEPALPEMWAVPRALRGETANNVEYTLHRRDTGETWIGSYNFAPIRDKDGMIVGSVVVACDITERKRAEKALRESEERYRGIVETTEEGVATHEPNGTITYVNQRMADMLGYSREEIIRRSSLDFVDEEEREAIIQARESVKERGSFSKERRLHPKDGSVLWTLVNVSPRRDDAGNFLGYLAMHTDITELKKTQLLVKTDLEALTLMHMLSRKLIGAQGIKPLLKEIMDAAVEIVNAQKGTLQLLEGNSLCIVAHHGHQQPFLDYFESAENVASVCGVATQRGERVVIEDVEKSSLFAGTPSLDVMREAGVRAVQSTPMLSLTGELMGILTTQWDIPYSPNEHDLWRIDLLARQAADMIEQARSEEALRESNAHLEAELVDIKLLQSISAELLPENNTQELYEKIIDAAMKIMHSDYASMQMLYPERGKGGELRLLAFRGFSLEAAKFWEWVGTDSAGSTCGETLRTGKRVIIPDVEKCDYMQGTEDLAMFLQTDIRACQTTPLYSRSGNLVGMISTHWHNPHQPSERDLRLWDILARQAADLIDRKKAEEALRESEACRKVAEAVKAERQRLFDVLETLPAMVCLLTPDYHVAFSNRTFREKFGESGSRHCYEYCYGLSKPCEFCEAYQVLETGKPHNWEVTTPDGSMLDVYNFPFTDVDGSLMILEMDLDITERKKAEETLKLKLEELRSPTKN